VADAVEQCPDCGNPLSGELGGYSEDLLTGTVTCQHCGAMIELKAETAEPMLGEPPGSARAAGQFGAEQAAEGVAGKSRDDPL
jgi:hypothetical protein